MKTKSILLVLIIAILSCASLIAADNFWLGAGFAVDDDRIDSETKQYYVIYKNDYSSISTIHRIGPSLEITYFLPFFKPIGIHFSSTTLIPVGFNADILYGYESQNSDYQEKINLGITANIKFNNHYGMYLTVASDSNFNRIAKINDSNSKKEVDYYRYDTHGMNGTIGFFANNKDSSYFRLGFSYAHSFTDDKWSTNMTLTGGLIL